LYKFGIVSFLDHKDMLAYLTGKSETSSKITAPVEVPVSAGVISSEGASSSSAGMLSFQSLAGAGKRTREDEEEEGPGTLTGNYAPDDSRPYDLMDAMGDDDELVAASSQPLSEAQIRVRQKKKKNTVVVF
jgi:hypothetical protein